MRLHGGFRTKCRLLYQMKDKFTSLAIRRVESLLNEYDGIKSAAGNSPVFVPNDWTMKADVALNELAPGSKYIPKDIDVINKHNFKYQLFLSGLRALYDDLQNGYFGMKAKELHHAEIFEDHLEMAEHFLELDYKDASAVLAGSVLESHLRQLANKHSVPTVDDRNKAIAISQVTTGLRMKDVFSLSEEKQLNSWQTIRNDAAHGDYVKVKLEAIRPMIDGIRRFMIEYPA